MASRALGLAEREFGYLRGLSMAVWERDSRF